MVCPERIVSAFARRICPVEFSEMSLPAAGHRVRKRSGFSASAVRWPSWLGCSFIGSDPECACQKKIPPIRVFLLELRNSDALLLSLTFFVFYSIEGALWP